MFFLSSCSGDKKIDSLTAAQCQALGGQEALQILLGINDHDVLQIVRISSCPEAPLRRVLKGEALLSKRELKKIKGIVHQILVSKTTSLDQLDPAKQTWAHKSERFLTVENRFVFWLIVIVGAVIVRVVGPPSYPIIFLYLLFIIVIKLYIYFYIYPVEPALLKTAQNLKQLYQREL